MAPSQVLTRPRTQVPTAPGGRSDQLLPGPLDSAVGRGHVSCTRAPVSPQHQASSGRPPGPPHLPLQAPLALPRHPPCDTPDALPLASGSSDRPPSAQQTLSTDGQECISLRSPGAPRPGRCREEGAEAPRPRRNVGLFLTATEASTLGSGRTKHAFQTSHGRRPRSGGCKSTWGAQRQKEPALGPRTTFVQTAPAGAGLEERRQIPDIFSR